ncbi:hypothetical protein FB451DRAFT_1239362 [Mycena latifolia]|nr:hypothetical protein FB451DRAFT_1239362 [Mycena latifolia]
MDHRTPFESPQIFILKDCLARRLLSCSELRNSPESESDGLDDFAAYLAHEVWPTLPAAFLSASYETRLTLPSDVDSIPLDATPVSFTDSLVSYGLAADADRAQIFLRKVLADYADAACAPPPVWSTTRTTECEICERAVPLTYHHLIPRSTHAKARKKGWHAESVLNSVAWLCRPCHTVVHQVATNEELAREYYSVTLLLQREDIQRWGRYASKQRFGVRRG